MNVSTSAVRTFAGIVGFSLFLSWPYCAFSMSSLFVFDTHGGELNNACWVVSLLFVSATLFALSLAGKHADRLLASTFATCACIVAHAVANALIIFGGTVPGLPGAVAVMAGCAITGIATGFLHVRWGMRVLENKPERIPAIVVVSYVCGFATVIVVSLLPGVARPWVVLAAIVLSGVALLVPKALMPSRSGVCEAAATSIGHEGAAPACATYQKDQARGTGARNASMPPVRALSSRDYAIVFFCFVCVSVVDSIYRPARMVDRDMFSLALVLAALAAIVFAAALMRLSHHATFGTVTRIVTPVLCLSLFLAAYLPEKLLYVAYAITFASMTVIVIFIWIAGILHSARTEGGLRKSLGLPLGFHYAGAVVGSLMAPLLDVMGVAALAFLLTIAACSVVIARSHDAEGQPPLIVPAYRDLRPTAFERIASRFDLTERESQIFALFASGRNSSYICKTCFISKNTVDTHLKHIYDKTGVRSKQGLIDLVEEEEGLLADHGAR